MTIESLSDQEKLKAQIKAVWMAGDYSRIAEVTQPAADEFVARRGLQPEMRVLDLACGSGNLAIPAARSGAIVTGIDIVPGLLDHARTRARHGGLSIRFDEGDAAQLPYADRAFDWVISMFGVMFVPQVNQIVQEMTRVCRPGGQIALASWTPLGFVGQLFKITGRHVPSPPGNLSPLLWGDDAAVRDRLSAHVTQIQIARHMALLTFELSVPDTVEHYRKYYGPTQKSFASLSDDKQPALRADLEALYAQHNKRTDGTTRIEAEYLEVVATVA